MAKTRLRKRFLDIVNDLVQSGRATITTREVRDSLDLSAAAASNLLSRIVAEGLLDRVAKGRYVIRPIGSWGTRAASEDTALAVAALFAHREHRIAYRSALAHHELISHPSRTVQVASVDQVTTSEVSGRPLHVILEKPETIEVGAIEAGHDARVSDIERALLDAARRPHFVGGLSVVAEALENASDVLNVDRILKHADSLDLDAAVRHLGSIAHLRAIDNVSAALQQTEHAATPLPADPRATSPVSWSDPQWGVVWSSTGIDSVRGTAT